MSGSRAYPSPLAAPRCAARDTLTAEQNSARSASPSGSEAEPPPAAEPQAGPHPAAAGATTTQETGATSLAPSEGRELAQDGAGLLVPALGVAGVVLLATLYSSLSASLARTLPSVFDDARHDPETSSELRRHLGADLEKTERLAASASLAAFVLRAAAAAGLLVLVRQGTGLGLLESVLVTAGAGGLALHLFTQSLPLALAQSRAQAMLIHGLPALAITLRPFGWAIAVLTWLRQPILRILRTPDANHETRRLVEGFRAMVEESSLRGELAADTREMIANVIDFSEVDAAEVMTPRTEIRAVEKDAGLAAAIQVFAESGFSRIPVFAETVDSIIGTLTALEAAKAVAEGRLETTPITAVMRPPLLVPETKLVPELLADFRAQRQKMAIVVDEYGGTAGLVTLADVMAEVLGDVDDEFAEEDRGFVTTESGAVDTDASLHVSEVNEELGLEIPEEADYETLAGFVLSELGRFPSKGERLEAAGAVLVVTEASDRRVLRVTVDLGPQWRQERIAAETRRLEERGAGPRVDPARVLRHSQAG